jgi:hypothetical protein
MATHAMIDIETLGTKPNAVILSVGVIKFDPFTSNKPFNGKHWKIDVDAQTEIDREVNEDTLAWWSKQDPEIQEEAFGETGRTNVTSFMKELNAWLTGCDSIWCQGPQFDMVILEDFFDSFNYHKNWFYWQVSDCRTLFKMMPQDPRKGLQQNLHNALEDSRWQAICVQKFFKDFSVLPR